MKRQQEILAELDITKNQASVSVDENGILETAPVAKNSPTSSTVIVGV